MIGASIYDDVPRCASQFTGKERDTETGLDYFGARYYGSTMGRFMSGDPKPIDLHHLIDPQQLNRYTYVRNNPLAATDPDGREVRFQPGTSAADKQMLMNLYAEQYRRPSFRSELNRLSESKKLFTVRTGNLPTSENGPVVNVTVGETGGKRDGSGAVTMYDTQKMANRLDNDDTVRHEVRHEFQYDVLPGQYVNDARTLGQNSPEEYDADKASTQQATEKPDMDAATALKNVQDIFNEKPPTPPKPEEKKQTCTDKTCRD